MPYSRRVPFISNTQLLDPLSISGLQFWVDSDDASTFTYSSGVLVSQWNDKSGNARHVAQGTPANQPSRNGSQNGRTTVVFNGLGDVLFSAAFTVNQPCTILGSVKFNNADATNRQWFANSNQGPTMYTTGGTWSMYAGTEVTDGADDALWHTFSAVFNGASSDLWKDGASILSGVNAGTESIKSARLGADTVPNNFWDGDIAEVLVYSGALSAGDRQSLEAYLKTKWGTP